jgi:hypothetical protein
MNCLRILASVFFLAVLSAGPAFAEKRLALVIGIDAYQEVPALEKAAGDARAIGAALGRLGFSVTTVIDANRRDLNRSIADFQKALSPGDVALFQFSGHGVEIDGVNYLLPADVPKPESGDKDYLKDEAISLDSVLARLDATGAAMRILIIDACRDNPFSADGTRGIGSERGLARVEAPKGTFIMYSAGYRQTALDRLSDADPESTSVYTRVLLRQITQQGRDIADIAKSVRSEVAALAKSVGHDQFPAYYDELTGPFILKPEPNALSPSSLSSPTADIPTDTGNISEASDLEFWQSVKDSSDPFLLKAYLDKFPGGIFTDLAKARVKLLQAPSTINENQSLKTTPKKSASDAKTKTKTTAPEKAPSRKLSTASQDGKTPAPSSLSTKSCREGNKQLCRLNCSAGVARACRKLQQLGG